MDERIDIEVVDKVASTIRPELLGIGAAAKAAHPEITKLKNSLSGMKLSGMASFRKMASDANALAASTTKLSTAQMKAAVGAQRLAQEEAKTALAQERVRTQAARTLEIETRSYLANERALNQAVAAETKAIGVKNRLAAASEKAANAANKEADAALKLQNSYDNDARAARSQTNYNNFAGIGRKTKSARDSYDVFDKAGVIDKTSASLDKMGKKAELGRHHLLNLGFQVQDLVVSLQAGQNPLTVFIQQGGQIGQIAAQSGVGIGGMAKAIGGILYRAVFSVTGGMVALVAAAGAVGVAMLQGSQETAKLNNALSISYNRASLSASSFYALADSIAESNGKSVASVREVAAAYAIDGRYTQQSIEELTRATQKFADLTGQSADDVVKEWAKMAKSPIKFAYELSETYNILTVAQVKHIRALEKQGKVSQATSYLTKSLDDALKDNVVNLGYLERAWNAVTKAISDAIDMFRRWGAEETVRPWSKVVSDIQGEIANKQNATWATFTGSTRQREQEIAKLRRDLIWAQNWASIEEQRNKRKAEADEKTRTTIGAMAEADKKKPKKPPKPKEDRAGKAVAELNRDLKREGEMLARNLVGIDAVVAERMASIEDSLDNVGVKLKDEQGNWTAYGKSVEATVRANEEGKISLARLGEVYAATVQPGIDWANTQAAAAKAIKLFPDDAENITRWLKQQEIAMRRATNPMYDYNKGMRDQTELLKFHGQELEIQTEIQRRYNAMVAADPTLEGMDKNSLRGEVTSDIKKQQSQNFLGELESDGLSALGLNVGGNQWIIDNYADLYKRIDEMRKGDVESERNAAAAKQELDKRYRDARLAGTSQMLDTLSGLQESSIREIAAIGKAAAIAKATIDGITAVQEALPNVPLAIATGVLAAANVAKIAGVGFQKGGYTGDLPAHAVAGAVHGREYVMDAASTARIGVPALDALRAGRLNPPPAANNNGPKVTVINNAGAAVEVRQRSDGELEILVDRALERKMGPAMERRLSDPNSRESRAIGSNFKVQRSR